MHWGVPGTINSSVSSQGISVMATSRTKTSTKAEDEFWNDIFENLVIENEPPTKYIRSVIIHTKDGSYIKVSGKTFAEIIEAEKHLDPEQSEIKSCRMELNFPKLRADVELWTTDLLHRLDGVRQELKVPAKRNSKKTKAKAKSSATVTKKTSSRSKKTKPASRKRAS